MKRKTIILSEKEKTLQSTCENKKDKLFYNKSVSKSKIMIKLNTVAILNAKIMKKILNKNLNSLSIPT